MSKLGDIYSNYGKHFNIGIANTYGENVLTGSNLPKNSLIISAPIDKEGEDIGLYSLFATDSEGSPVRLTYVIQEGNGLKYEDDRIYLSINDDYITSYHNTLGANVSYLIDLDTINIKNNLLTINVDALDIISNEHVGVFKIDGETIHINNDTIYVNTPSLEKSSTDTFGIGMGDGVSIFAINGIFSIDTQGLTTSSEGHPGLIFTTSNKLNIENGVISIVTENLEKATSSSFGICSPDDNTISSNDGILKVNTENLVKGDSSNYGVVKYDGETIQNNDDSISVKDYDKLINSVDGIQESIVQIDKTIDDIKYLLDNYGFGVQKPLIFKFYCPYLLSSVLELPKYQDDPNEMPTQLVSVEFIINTNCPFNISLEFIDNVEPQVTLYEINFGDIIINQGNAGLSTRYQTTEEKDVPLKFSFLCKNYFNSDSTEYSNNTNIKIRVTYDNDALVYRELIFTIVRFNSNYTEEINSKENYVDYMNSEEEPQRKPISNDQDFEISISNVEYSGNGLTPNTELPVGIINVVGNNGKPVTFTIGNIEIIGSGANASDFTVENITNNTVKIYYKKQN